MNNLNGMIDKILKKYGYVNSDIKIYEFNNTNENDYAKIMLTKNFIIFTNNTNTTAFKYEDVINNPELIKPLSLHKKEKSVKKFSINDAIKAIEEMDSIDLIMKHDDRFDVVSLIDGSIICSVKEIPNNGVQVYYEFSFNYANISLYYTGNKVRCSQKEHFKNAILEAEQASECYKEYISKFNKLM